MKIKRQNLQHLLLALATLTCWMSAHSSTASASHGMIPFTSSMTNKLLQMGSLDLKEVAYQDKTGFQFEPVAVRTQWQTWAREYASARARSSPKKDVTSMLSNCEGKRKIQTNQNFFCQYESDRIDSFDDKREERILKLKDRHETFSKAKVLGWIKSQDLTNLSLTPFTNLVSAVGQLRGGSTELISLTEKLLEPKDNCQSGALYTALGGRWEDELPDVDAQNKVMGLYRRAAECSKDTASMQARYRLALFSIGKNDCQNVNELLKEVESSKEQASLHTRAKYWRHFCGLQNKQADVVLETRESLMNNYPLSYHNLALNGDNAKLNDYVLGPAADAKGSDRVQIRSIVNPDLNQSILAIEALMSIDHSVLAGEIIEASMKDWPSAEPDVRLYLAALANQADLGVTKFKLMSQLFSDSVKKIRKSTLEMFFPADYMEQIKQHAKTVDPLLVVSLIRQESAFNQNARSPVGARGLMQVMPATARSIASVNTKNLMDPNTNIRVGTKYLQYRLNHFDGDVELTLAAYNAGFARVEIWKRRYQVTNKLLFLDLIPYKETREYVATILRNYYWYTKLYETAKPDPIKSSKSEQRIKSEQKIRAIMQANVGRSKSSLQ